MVYASSSSAYGDDPALPKVETLPANPISPYAVSKLAAEHYCRTFARLYGLETVSLRYFNVFGPRQNPESKYSAVIPRFLELALAARAARDPRRRRAVARLHLHRQRRAGEPARDGHAGRVGRGVQHRLRHAPLAARRSPTRSARSSAASSRASTRRRAPATSSTRSPTSRRPSACSAIEPDGRLRDRHPTDLRVLRRALRRRGATAVAGRRSQRRGRDLLREADELGPPPRGAGRPSRRRRRAGLAGARRGARGRASAAGDRSGRLAAGASGSIDELRRCSEPRSALRALKERLDRRARSRGPPSDAPRPRAPGASPT